MFSRIALLAVTLFWVTMTCLLWRSEYGNRNHLGSIVPTSLVWKKILTAPDNSTLDLFHQGRKSGFFRWATSVGTDGAVPKTPAEDSAPEGMVARPAGYRLDLDGNLTGEEFGGRIHFNFELRLAADQTWQRFALRVNIDRDLLEVRSIASEQSVHFRTDLGGETSEHTVKLADLGNPQALAREFEVLRPLALLGMPGLTANGPKAGSLLPGLNWEARNDWITIGHTTLRAYRLRAKVLDRYELVVVVSPVGEILRVELPDGWLLTNDQLGAL